jgi:hypothetical protein
VPEETLIQDVRAGLTPSQMVERKLLSLSQRLGVPVSIFRQRGTRTGRQPSSRLH